MTELIMVSLMADNARLFYRALAEHINQSLDIKVRVVDNADWLERERMLDQESAHIGFVCGLQYLHKTHLELLAAPIMSGRRYRQRPVYYSDMVVAAGSHYHSFDDLAGSTLAYNEPTSHSGCNLIRFHLARLGKDAGFFGRIVESGSHQQSLNMIPRGTADVSAIDSTVLELEMRQQPELRSGLRIVQTLGPSPIPPAVISRRLEVGLRREIRDLLLGMNGTDSGMALLNRWMIAGFARVRDRDYEPIRRMERKALEISFP